MTAVGTGRTQCWLQAVRGCCLSIYCLYSVTQCQQFQEGAKDATVSECTWTLGALEALRNALYKFKTYLLTYTFNVSVCMLQAVIYSALSLFLSPSTVHCYTRCRRPHSLKSSLPCTLLSALDNALPLPPRGSSLWMTQSLFVKLETALLIGPAENCPIFSSMRLLIHKLFWASGEGCKIASCIAPLPRHDIYIPFKSG